jgi:hypothetical protein
MYKFKTDEHGIKVFIKETEESVTSFLADPDNTDYQQYLAWLAEGNFPFAADALMPQENGDTFTLSA